MIEKIKLNRENMGKIIVALIIATVVFLAISILTDTGDNRKQITSNSSTEETLCNILSDIKGVGQVDAMIQYDSESQVTGVIVTAEGASNSVTRKNIIDGVSTLFDIPVANVVVYEKK